MHLIFHFFLGPYPCIGSNMDVRASKLGAIQHSQKLYGENIVLMCESFFQTLVYFGKFVLISFLSGTIQSLCWPCMASPSPSNG